MRKKEIRALLGVAVILLATLAVGAAGSFAGFGVGPGEIQAGDEPGEDEEPIEYAMGETAEVEVMGGLGTLEITIDEASLYSSLKETGLPADDGHCDTSGKDLENLDDCLFLVCKATVRNVDASAEKNKNGTSGFLFNSPPANAVEWVYFDGSAKNADAADFNYFALEQGEEKRYTVCWAIPENDGLSDLPESVELRFSRDVVFLLTPKDCR